MDPGCDMTEAELLAMLRGIDAGKIQRQTEKELESKYGAPASSAERAARKRVEASSPGVGAGGGGPSDAPPAAESAAPGSVASVEGFLASAPEDHTGAKSDLNQYWYSAASIRQLLAEVRSAAAAATPGQPMRVAFVSTPSLFFSLGVEERKHCAVLDFDRQWEREHGFCFYDFNSPLAVPAALVGAFDVVVVDPPFVQEACWRAYASTAKLLLKHPPVLPPVTPSSPQPTPQPTPQPAPQPAGAANPAAQAASAAALATVAPEAPPTPPPQSTTAGAPAEAAAAPAPALGRVILTTILENEALLWAELGAAPNVFRPSIPNLVYQYHIFTNYPAACLAEVNPEVGV